MANPKHTPLNEWGYPTAFARKVDRAAEAVSWLCMFAAGFIFGGAAAAYVVKVVLK